MNRTIAVPASPAMIAWLGLIRAWSENKTLAGRAAAPGGAPAPTGFWVTATRFTRLRPGARRCRGWWPGWWPC